jgi:hypothetical protein
MPKRSKGLLTERDRFWLRHHAAYEASGESVRAYARKHRLSEHALYQSRKRLRALGEWDRRAPVKRQVRKRRKRPSPAFVRAGVLSAGEGTRYRVRLANGAMLEWEGQADPVELEGVLSALRALG